MGIYFLVEEPSIRPVIESIMKSLIALNPDQWFEVKIHQGKQDLQKALRSVVPTLSRIPNVRIMIVHDQDQNDCISLKQELLNSLQQNCHCPFKIRIVCRELESWFLGDMTAIEKAFPRFKPGKYAGQTRFRNPDIVQKPSAALLDIIPEYSNLKTLPKVNTSEKISPFLDREGNRSNSFGQFIEGIDSLLR